MRLSALTKLSGADSLGNINMKQVTAIFMATAFLGGLGTAAAHHSASMFDFTKLVELSGVVKEFQYTNPHSWLLVDVTNEDGSVTTWGFEAEGPKGRAR